MNKLYQQQRRAAAWRNRFGPWALVTGASDGIGQAIAHTLARRGVNLALCARRADRLAALSGVLRTQHGIETRILAVDLSRPDAPGALLADVADLDVGLLVASAGFGSAGPLASQPVDAETEMVDVNCRAVLALCHGLAPRLQARGRGGMVLMSSLFAFQGVPGSANYAATKAYVQTLAEGLALELRGDGVDVLAVAPGPTRSGFAERAGMRMSMAQAPERIAEETLRALGRAVTTRPGWLSKVLEASLFPLPRRLRSRILGQVMRGMTVPRPREALEGGTAS